MGYERCHAIVVTDTGYGNHIENAHSEALAIFADVCEVTEITPEAMNRRRSFMVAPDGSKEGWDLSDRGDACRDLFVAWLERQAYDDGSSALDWAEVQYGDENLDNRLLRSDADLYAARRT